jgi:hypothetical protein
VKNRRFHFRLHRHPRRPPLIQDFLANGAAERVHVEHLPIGAHSKPCSSDSVAGDKPGIGSRAKVVEHPGHHDRVAIFTIGAFVGGSSSFPPRRSSRRGVEPWPEPSDSSQLTEDAISAWLIPWLTAAYRTTSFPQSLWARMMPVSSIAAMPFISWGADEDRDAHGGSDADGQGSPASTAHQPPGMLERPGASERVECWAELNGGA